MKALLIYFCIISCNLLFAQVNSNTTDTLHKEILNKNNSIIWDVFKNRRSVREFNPNPIPKEDILKIIDAARMAPSAGNQQPWKFLIITDKNKINEMKEACIKNTIEYFKKNKKELDASKKNEITNMYNNYFSAPVYIIVLTENNSIYPSYNQWDGPIAAGYLLLAARALGYGTVFITDSIPESVTKEVFKIPDTYTRVCITPVGIPVKWPAGPKKKMLNEFIIENSF